jgi:hypothetical protein
MTHFSSGTIEKTTPLEWLAVGSKIGQQANAWAHRDDLVAYVGDSAGVGKGAPAIFNPRSAEIEVNIPIAFGHVSPEQVGDMTNRDQQFEFLKASGAIFHEAMHARFTTWDLEKAATELSQRACEALHLLEESRIEGLGVRIMPQNRSFLRACALEIVLGDIKEGALDKMSSTRQAAHMMALTYARVDAGVLEMDDIEPVTEVIKRVLPTDTVADLSKVWREFHTLRADLDVERMYELAIEWDRIVTDRAEENGESEGAGEMSEAMKEFIQEMSDALEEAVGSASISAVAEAGEQQTKEEYQQSVADSRSKSEEMKEHKGKASDVFGKNSTPTKSGSRSELRETRLPTSEERVSAVQLSQALEKAKYRDRIRIETASATPPGRMRSRALVQGEAYRERGLMVETTPFNHVQRKHTEDPNLTVGVMVDISGSMSSAMNPMASAAWILSEAGKRIQARTAMVYYGNGVFPTLKAGQHLDKVNVYTATDGTERFGLAFEALDGSLNLLHGSGARLLVIVSDGQYTQEERKNAERWIARCKSAGVGVMWIGAGHYGEMAKEYCNGKESVFTRMGSSAVDVANEIGRAAATALTRAGQVRNS